jgi:hypothetical protein
MFQENDPTQIRVDQYGIDPLAYFFRYADFDAILLARTESARRFQNLRVLVGKGRHPSTLALGDFR